MLSDITVTFLTLYLHQHVYSYVLLDTGKQYSLTSQLDQGGGSMVSSLLLWAHCFCLFLHLFSCHSCHLGSDLVRSLSFCFSRSSSSSPVIYLPHSMPVLALSAFVHAQCSLPSLPSHWASVLKRSEERGRWSHTDLDFTLVLSN